MRRARIVTIAMILACSLAGCSDDSEPEADPEPTPSTSASASPTPTPTASPSGPAGELITTDAVSLRAPATWTVEDRGSNSGVGKDLFPPSGAPSNSIAVFISRNPPTYSLSAYQDFSLRQMRSLNDPNARVLPRTTIDGQPAFHVRGKDQTSHMDYFGSIYGENSISIDFELSGTKAERQAIIDEVLNSVEWK